MRRPFRTGCEGVRHARHRIAGELCWRPAAMPRSSKHIMVDHVVPHFHNDPGVPVIEIGAREFMCIGATPPFDHPHVFLDMGEEHEVICPYCSTLYRHNLALHGAESRPAECAWVEPATA
jgi:uncharacterized Zn-finger protein